MSEQLALLPEYLTAHLQLTLLALAIGALVSIPAGVLVTRFDWLEQPVLGVASVIQTIPSLALLAVMVPTLAALNFQSIGYLPAFIGLTLYSILPMLRNTVTGIREVDPALIEAARGVGMTPAQQLRRVELPLAMPVIVAGVRTSTVWIVGIATLSTPVGATSLGNYIFTGLQTRNYTAVLVGCVAAAALAIVLDGIVWALEQGVQKNRRGLTAASLAVLGLIAAYTLASALYPLATREQDPIVIGSKTFTEQYILSQVLARRIDNETGLPTRVRESLGSTVAFDALESGELDLYVDYTGTIWTTIMDRGIPGRSRREVLEEVEQWLSTERGIEVVAPLGFQNAYVLAMRRDHAERLGVEVVSDLTPHASDLVVGGDYEFFGRPEWEAVRQAYDLTFRERRSMDSSLMYQAVAQGDVDVISAFSTDGRIEVLNLKVLEDDRDAIPPYDAVILARPGLIDERPEVVEALQVLENAISVEKMRQLNAAVDEGGRSPGTVAASFLDELVPDADSASQ